MEQLVVAPPSPGLCSPVGGMGVAGSRGVGSAPCGSNFQMLQ